jgi:hypothetical protein
MLAASIGVLAGCSGSKSPASTADDALPPPLNAIDPSLSCPTGQVGWDFSTGGGTEKESLSSEPIRGIRITKAWYGANCAGAKGFDFTDDRASSCAGKDVCQWLVTSAADIAPGCAKQAEIEWQCGVETTKYVLRINSEAWGQTLTPTCGGKIKVVSASYGHNVGTTPGAYTTQMGMHCNDKRNCTYTPSTILGDVVPGRVKATQIDYTCGNDNTIYSKVSGEEQTTISCVVQASPYAPTISVVSTVYGNNCPGGVTGEQISQQTAITRALCDGKVACSAGANSAVFPDPKPGCLKTLDITWTCGSDGTRYSTAAGDGSQAVLSCATQESISLEGVRLVSASYGENCNAALAGNWTDIANQTCTGKNQCDVTIKPTSDVAVGCAKEFKARYRCSGESQTYESNIAGESGGKTAHFECPAPIKIVTATIGSNCAQAAILKGNATSTLQSVCQGKRGSCTYQIAFPYDPAPGCPKQFDATYTCGSDPTQRFVTVPGEALNTFTTLTCPVLAAPQLSLPRKGCVPSYCEGRKNRNQDLQCVEAPDLGDLSSFSLSSIAIAPSNGGEFGGTMFSNSAYTISAKYSHTGTPARTRLTLWATDVFKNNVTGASVEGFACEMTGIYVDSDGKGAVQTTPLFASVVSPECFGQRNTWGDAAYRTNLSEPAFRQGYTFTGSRLRASLDPQGSYYTKPRRPNPPGFFYKPNIPWLNMIAYLEQNEVTGFTAPPISFNNSPTKLEIGVKSAELQTKSAAVALFSKVSRPSIDVAFTWYANGQNMFNPYSVLADSPPIPALPPGQTVRDKRLSSYVWIGPTARPSERRKLMVQGNPVGSPLALGTAESVKANMSEDIVQLMFDGWKSDNTFDIEVCLEMDGAAPALGAQSCLPGVVVNGKSYSACIGPVNVCQKAGVLTIISKDPVKRQAEYQRPTDKVENANESASGDARVKSSGGSAQQSGCTSEGEMTQCNSVRRNDNQNAGAFGGSNFKAEQETSRKDVGETSTLSADMTGELRGFQVLDVMDPMQEKKNQWLGAKWASPKLVIKIEPPWDLIIPALKESTKAFKPISPAVVKAQIGKDAGLGIGVGIEGPLQFGPIPGHFTASATANFSIALEITAKYVAEGEDGKEETYPCIGQAGTKCFSLHSEAKSFLKAAEKCQVSGGKLAEMATQADKDAISAAINKADRPPTATWLGGQSTTIFKYGVCARDEHRNTLSCIQDAKISFRWVGSDREFAYYSANGAQNGSSGGETLYSAAAKNGPACTSGCLWSVPKNLPTSNLDLAAWWAPNQVGVAFMTATGGLQANYPNVSLPFVCEYDAANEVKYSGTEVRIKLGAAAGLNAEVCSPTDKIGICVHAGFNFIELGVSPGVSRDNYSLFDANHKLFGQRGNTHVDVPWQVTALTGSVDATLKMPILSLSWPIAEFKGYILAGGKELEYDWPSSIDYDACALGTCKNGGSCRATGKFTYSCTCAAGFSGPTCSTRGVK